MHPLSLTTLFTLSLAISPLGTAASLRDVAPYPEAEKGFTRPGHSPAGPARQRLQARSAGRQDRR